MSTMTRQDAEELAERLRAKAPEKVLYEVCESVPPSSPGITPFYVKRVALRGAHSDPQRHLVVDPTKGVAQLPLD